MEENSRFGFCPKCGAVSKDGVCLSCSTQASAANSTVSQWQQSCVQNVPQNLQPQGSMPPPAQVQGMDAGCQPQQNQPQNITGAAQWQGGAGYQVPQNQPQGGAGYQPPRYQAYAAVPPVKPVPRTGKNVKVIFVCYILAIIILTSIVMVILFAVGDLQKERAGKGGRTEPEQETVQGFGGGEAQEEEKEPWEKPVYYHHSNEVTERNRNEAGQDAALSYYSGPYNALQDNLSYELVFWEEVYSARDMNVELVVEYPRIASGEVENKDYINMALHYEYDYFHNMLKEEFMPQVTSGDDIFYVHVDSHVTYMDEKILSVVFVENVYLTLGIDTLKMINYYCMNFDLEAGVLIENTEVLRLDDTFAADFKRREAEENGGEALEPYSDQEILSMLQDPASLVLFYTPMGLEVGLNLESRVVYVTYADYEQFLNIF